MRSYKAHLKSRNGVATVESLPFFLSLLGRVGGERALALLEKTLTNQDANVRVSTVSALGRVGGEQALALLGKALADLDANVRRLAAR